MAEVAPSQEPARSTLLSTLEPLRFSQSCFYILLVAYLALYAPVILAGRQMYDDLERGTSGPLDWWVAGRPLADALYWVLSLGTPVFSTFFRNQILSVALLAVTATLLAGLFPIRRPLSAALAAFPIGGQPYLLHNVSYTFDSPLVAAAMFTATLSAVALAAFADTMSILLSGALLLCSLTIYQPTVNLYAIIVTFLFVRKLINDDQDVLKFTLRALGSLLLAGIVYGAYEMFAPLGGNNPYGQYVLAHSTLPSVAGLSSVVAANIEKYWTVLFSDFGPDALLMAASAILLIGLGYLFRPVLWKRLSLGHFALSLTLAALMLAAFVCQFGISLALADPIWEPRVFLAAGVFPALLALQTASALRSSNPKRSATYPALFLIPILVLDYSFFVVADAAGAASREQLSFERALSDRLIIDIERVLETASVKKLVILGKAPVSEVLVNTARKFPIVGRIVQDPFDNQSPWGPKLLDYFGLPLIQDATEPYRTEVMAKTLQPRLQRTSYDIFVSGETVVVSFH